MDPESAARTAILYTAVTTPFIIGVSYLFYRAIAFRGVPQSASDYGRKFAAWLAVLALMSGLVGFVSRLDAESFAAGLVVTGVFGALGFGVGFLFGQIFGSARGWLVGARRCMRRGSTSCWHW